jgi:hypothetical protein
MLHLRNDGGSLNISGVSYDPAKTSGTITLVEPGQSILADTAEVQTSLAMGGAVRLLVEDVPTTTEFEARTLPSADYFIVSDFTGFSTPGDITTAQGVITTAITASTTSIKGASSKDLTQVFTAIGSVTTIGPGSTLRTYTVTRSDTGAPIPDAEVWVTTDTAGANVIAGTLTTDDAGQVKFMLDAGTYYYWVKAAGYTAVGPDTEVYI